MNNLERHIFLICVGLPLMSANPVLAQLTLNQPNSIGSYKNTTSITLAPGFNSTGPFRAYIQTGGALLNSVPSAGLNYIRKTTYFQGFNVPPSNPTTDDAMQDITYYDGLGRPLQEVGVRASGTGAMRDLVTPVTYDAFGRKDKDYLPYGTATGVGGAFKANATAQQATYYNSPTAGVVKIPAVGGVTPSFSSTVYEP